MALEFALKLGHTQNWDEMKAFAQAADRLGFDTILIDDHFISIPPAEPHYEAWTVISMLAAVTERMRLGHEVLCQSYRNPGLMAKMTATLDCLSGGRFDFAIGCGWFELEYGMYNLPFPPIKQRLQEFREYVEICKLLWTEESASYQGQYYAVEDAVCEPKPAQRPYPRIVIGGAGEKVMLRIVAEHADVWNNFQTYFLDVENKLEILKRHCDDAGRDFGEIKVAQQTLLLLGKDEAEGKARLQAELEGMHLADPETTGIWGHPQRVIDEIGKHAEKGVHIFNFSGVTDVADLELFAAEVMPAFR